VIGVAEGGVRETVIDGVNGRLITATPDELAKTILDFMRDPARAREMGRAGRRIVENQWTLDAANERLEVALAQAVR
jgi:glycosyltransferase involved in cell wall biosynthesis